MEETMKVKRIGLILATIIILAILLVSCGKKQATTAPVESPVNTQAGAAPTVAVLPTSPPNEVPEDVPIMPDAYELQIANALNLTYKVNVKIEDVVAFYQGEFPNYGWDKTNNPDSVVASMAQMSRGKENGDRIAFSLQYNPVGEFTIVQIYIVRAP
jgi:PBP1b-binding outer membrane lipoprotein LpoB